MIVLDPYDHALDPLANLSVYRVVCRCCGKEVRASIINESPWAGLICGCGHFVTAENRVRWN